jgi:hypothetical protein
MGSEGMNVLAAPGGRCLAADQRVGTSRGAVTVEELAKGAGFEAISYDRKAQRYVARPARARATGRKQMVRLHTDKGRFELTADQPVVLETGESRPAAELTPGTRLCACEVKPELGNLVKSEDVGKERVDLAHLTAADCAVANWYPAASVERIGEAEVYQVEIEGGPTNRTGTEAGATAAQGPAANVVVWSIGPGGGIGIVVTA